MNNGENYRGRQNSKRKEILHDGIRSLLGATTFTVPLKVVMSTTNAHINQKFVRFLEQSTLRLLTFLSEVNGMASGISLSL